MAATIEAVQTKPRSETTARGLVTCIFCGLPTPVNTLSRAGLSDRVREVRSHVRIARCELCGKEAPYFEHEINGFEELAAGI
jgi:ribosomal protein S14